MQLRKGISTGAVAGVIIVILVVAGVGYYFVTNPTVTTTTATSTVTSTVTGGASSTTTSAAGNSITVMAISGFSDAFFNQTAKDYMAANPGTKVNIITAPFSGILAQEQTLLQAHDSSVDVVTGTPSMVGTIAQFTINLNPYITQYNLNKSDIIPAMQTSNGDVALKNGSVQTKALAMMSDTMFVYYRPSVFKQFSNLKPMGPTATWSDFIYDESYINNQTGWYGAFIETATAHELWNTFLDVYAANYHQSSLGPAQASYGILFTNKLLPSFNSTYGVQAVQTMTSMLNAQPSLIQSYGGFNYNNFVQYYTKGFNGKNFAMAIAWLAQFPSVNSTLNGDVAFATLPGGYTQEGGSGAGISAYSKNPTLAFKFLQFCLTPAEQAKMYDVQKAMPGTFSGYKTLISEHANLATFFTNALKAVQAGGAEPHIISSTWALIPILDNALASVLPPNGPFTSAQIMAALQTAANEWIPVVSHG